MEVSDQLHAPAALPPEREASGPQSRCGGGIEEKKNPFFFPAENLNPVVQPVA
jgi:hypothetical protein